MIDYQKILRQNMIGVLIDVLEDIKEHGINQNQLYITFLTKHESVKIPNWLIKKYPKEMTIVIQFEYYNLKINKKNFSITLSFNNIKTELKIGYSSIISFADPSVNFGLILQNRKIEKKLNKNLDKDKSKEDNIINFSKYKKNQSK